MLFKYKDIFLKVKSDYKIKKMLKNKELFKFENGLYSDVNIYTKVEEIVTLYPDAIFDSYSALYFLGILDYEPETNYIATKINYTRIKDPEIKQIFYPAEDVYEGVILQIVNGVEIKLYNKEKMLIHVIKNRKKIDNGTYKQIIQSYRIISKELSTIRLSAYLGNEKRTGYIESIISRYIL